MYGDKVRTTGTSRAEGRLKEFGERVRGKKKKDKASILREAVSGQMKAQPSGLDLLKKPVTDYDTRMGMPRSEDAKPPIPSSKAPQGAPVQKAPGSPAKQAAARAHEAVAQAREGGNRPSFNPPAAPRPGAPSLSIPKAAGDALRSLDGPRQSAPAAPSNIPEAAGQARERIEEALKKRKAAQGR